MTYPPPRNYAILSLLAVLASLPGCGRPWCLTKVADSEPTADPALIAEADREYDFGYLIATPGRKVEHRYRLTNATKQEIKILNIVNRKTCCGIVQVGKTILNPGDTTEVEVTLLVGDRFGQVTHETEVTTDLASVPSLVFRTAARAVPPIRILEDTAFDRTILIGAKEPRQAVFRAVASGTSAELPVDLDRLELRSEVKVVWAGQKEPGALDEGLRSEWRRFTATLDAAGPPGERRAEILLRRGETVLCRQPLTWEVASPMTASPKVIVMRAGQNEYRVVIRSLDEKPFRITRIECTVPGVQARTPGTTAATTQTMQVESLAESKGRDGEITVFTDHPAQQRLNLALVFIEQVGLHD